MEHAKSHFNVQPGLHGQPMIRHHMRKQLLDSLHYSELGIPKTGWKHGILNNASDDARDLISKQLEEWKHPLDCRRKDDNRDRHKKWFTGERWATFCAGERGSPGGPRAIATLMLIIADDLQERGVERGRGDGGSALGAAVGGRGAGVGRGRGRGRAAFTAARAVGAPDAPKVTANMQGTTHVPTEMEKNADPADLEMIHNLYGSRAQTIINTLLAFDAYFAWYYPLKESIPLLAPMAVREERALDNMRSAIDQHEILERVTIRNHKSFLPHGAIFKVTQDILEVGDIWAFNVSPLELQNAETKRVASTGGARNISFRKEGRAHVPVKQGKEGPANLSMTKGYKTSQALSTLNKLLAANMLRRGNGLYTTPASRRKERLFGVTGSGRTSARRAGVKLENLAVDYRPQLDTVLKAYVRLLAVRAEAAALEEASMAEEEAGTAE